MNFFLPLFLLIKFFLSALFYSFTVVVISALTPFFVCPFSLHSYLKISLETFYGLPATHTQPYSSLDFVQDNPGELVTESTFCHLLDFLVQNEDNTGKRTNNPDGLLPHPN